jgi:hypothetical protein
LKLKYNLVIVKYMRSIGALPDWWIFLSTKTVRNDVRNKPTRMTPQEISPFPLFLTAVPNGQAKASSGRLFLSITDSKKQMKVKKINRSRHVLITKLNCIIHRYSSDPSTKLLVNDTSVWLIVDYTKG